MVRNFKICEQKCFQDGDQHGRRNSESNGSQAVLSDTKTNKVSIHIK